MATKNYNQWSNARPYLGELPAHVKGYDQERVASYQFYEEIYWNTPETFAVVMRGSEDAPIYIPGAMKIIEAQNRFYGVGFDYSISGGSEPDREATKVALTTLFRREKFFTKFESLKRFGMVRGDALWHVVADADKPAGRRISIHELKPESYFPIYDLNDVEKITGCHIISQTVDEKGDPVIRRQTYRKDPTTGKITSELGLFETDGWDDRNILQETDPPEVKPVGPPITPLFELPDQITSLPVYHIVNGYQGGNLFGSSNLRGFERIMAAANQGITDEELTLALDGLGVYYTTLPRPKGGWVLGPGSVVEGEEGNSFARVSGVSSVQASQDHLAYLDKVLKEGSGTSDIAIGTVDVDIAESGIALALQMSPVLAKNREREQELLAVHDHMFFDLTHGWLPAYEGITAGINVTVGPLFGDPMPVNREAVIKEVTDLLGTTPPVISPEYARKILSDRLGYEFPDEMGADIITTLRNLTTATAYDPYENRIRQELAADLAEQNGGSAA